MELEKRLESMRDTHSEAGGGASGEEERRAREALLEDRLRAAESSVEEAKQAAGEMEGVVARLREEEVSRAVATHHSRYLLQLLAPGRSVSTCQIIQEGFFYRLMLPNACSSSQGVFAF